VCQNVLVRSELISGLIEFDLRQGVVPEMIGFPRCALQEIATG